MKKRITGLLFALLICLATVKGFGEEIYFIPLTWEIIRNERNNLNEADYYISRSFSIKIYDHNIVKSEFINGIIAYIQRLKGYASNARPSELAESLADPRWNMLAGFRGTVHTLEDLSRRWVPNNPRGYENNIKDIIYEMHLFSRQSI